MSMQKPPGWKWLEEHNQWGWWLPYERVWYLGNGKKILQWDPWPKQDGFLPNDKVYLSGSRSTLPVTIGKKLGSGFAKVYEAWVDERDEDFAVKVFEPRGDLNLAKAKFEAEIQHMERLKHPHIVKFYGAYIDAGRKPHQYGIVMEPAADEGNLEDFIDRCRRDSDFKDANEETLRNSFGCLLSAMAYLHSSQVLIRHKDIKPSNILIHEQEVVVTDFGSAVHGDYEGRLSTQDAIPTGHTDKYAAPEIQHGDTRNEKSDIFSLGAVFYEICCALDPGLQWYTKPYRDISSQLRDQIATGLQTYPYLRRVLLLVYCMLDPLRDRRPSAFESLMTVEPALFCPTCRELQRRCMYGAATLLGRASEVFREVWNSRATDFRLTPIPEFSENEKQDLEAAFARIREGWLMELVRRANTNRNPAQSQNQNHNNNPIHYQHPNPNQYQDPNQHQQDLHAYTQPVTNARNVRNNGIDSRRDGHR